MSCECPICYTEVQDGQAVKTRCGHTFCRACMAHLRTDGSMNQTCPICRRALDLPPPPAPEPAAPPEPQPAPRPPRVVDHTLVISNIPINKRQALSQMARLLAHYVKPENIQRIKACPSRSLSYWSLDNGSICLQYFTRDSFALKLNHGGFEFTALYNPDEEKPWDYSISKNKSAFTKNQRDWLVRNHFRVGTRLDREADKMVRSIQPPLY